uniref:Uncharacterized protein n=1 Tax=Cucumis melo TaxID=3656 RepID=A0A9I9DPL1_CUCME
MEREFSWQKSSIVRRFRQAGEVSRSEARRKVDDSSLWREREGEEEEGKKKSLVSQKREGEEECSFTRR